MSDRTAKQPATGGRRRRIPPRLSAWAAAASVLTSCTIGSVLGADPAEAAQREGDHQPYARLSAPQHTPRNLDGVQAKVASRLWAAGPSAAHPSGRMPGPSVAGSGPRPDVRRAITPTRNAHHPTAELAVRDAFAQLGKPYVYGGTGPRGFDCSGLTQHAWRAAGIWIPRTSQQQAHFGQPVDAGQVLPGDLVVYYPRRSHVAIYVGSGQVIYAPHAGAFVRLGLLHSMPVNTVRRP